MKKKSVQTICSVGDSAFNALAATMVSLVMLGLVLCGALSPFFDRAVRSDPMDSILVNIVVTNHIVIVIAMFLCFFIYDLMGKNRASIHGKSLLVATGVEVVTFFALCVFLAFFGATLMNMLLLYASIILSIFMSRKETDVVVRLMAEHPITYDVLFLFVVASVRAEFSWGRLKRNVKNVRPQANDE